MKRMGLVAAPAEPRGQKRLADGDPVDGSSGSAEPICSTAVAQFRQTCRELRSDWQAVLAQRDIVAIGTGVKTIVNKLSAVGGVVPAADGYVKKTIIRKLLCACPHTRSVAAQWSRVRVRDLQAWTPDEAGILEEFPESATAESISMLLFGRPDWGLLASMWGCLWKPVVPILTKAGMQTQSITPEQAHEIGRVALTLYEETGAESTPAAAVRRWLAGGACSDAPRPQDSRQLGAASV